MKTRKIIATSLMILAYSTSAHALCIYGGSHFTKSKERDFDGRLYATTTLTDEFQDSVLVVKGTVLSNRNIGHPYDGDWGTVYRVRINRTFKGKAPPIIHDYTNRDSGGFYLGEGGEGREYLLFLTPFKGNSWVKKGALGSYEVNYNCGQSRPWAKVTQKEVKQLNLLASHSPNSN